MSDQFPKLADDGDEFITRSELAAILANYLPLEGGVINGPVTTVGDVQVGQGDEHVVIGRKENNYSVFVAADLFADSVIRLNANWSTDDITETAAISTYDGQGIGNPYLFIAGPHTGTQVTDAARITVGITDDGTATLLFINADQTNITGGTFIKAHNPIYLSYTTTPAAIGSFGAIYAKSDDKLYFLDDSDVEHEVAFV